MTFTFIEVVILVILVIVVVTCKTFVESKSLITHTSLINQGFVDAYNYASNITGRKPFLQMEEREQDNFMQLVTGFLRMNYELSLKELNMFNNNEKICSMMVSKISQE